MVIKNSSQDFLNSDDELTIGLSVLHAVTHLTLLIETGVVTIPILQMRILRLTEVKLQAQYHTRY